MWSRCTTRCCRRKHRRRYMSRRCSLCRLVSRQPLRARPTAPARGQAPRALMIDGAAAAFLIRAEHIGNRATAWIQEPLHGRTCRALRRAKRIARRQGFSPLVGWQGNHEAHQATAMHYIAFAGCLIGGKSRGSDERKTQRGDEEVTRHDITGLDDRSLACKRAVTGSYLFSPASLAIFR